MIEVIPLNNSIKIYRTNIPYNKEELIKELYFNVDFNDITSTQDAAGRESSLVITSKNIEYIKLKSIDFITSVLYDNKDISYCQKNWVYINDRSATHAGWHNHENNHVSNTFKNQWTYTFYAQMPNNLLNNEGKLSFKVDNREYSILPKEGDIIAFPAMLLHKPELSPNSTQERIVIGGNFMEINVDRVIKKKQKSLV